MEQPGNASGELGTRAVCGPARGLRPGTGGATGAPRPRPRPGLMGGRGPCPRCSALVRPRCVQSSPRCQGFCLCFIFTAVPPEYTDSSHNSRTKEPPNQKLDRRPKQPFLQGRQTRGQRAPGKASVNEDRAPGCFTAMTLPSRCWARGFLALHPESTMALLVATLTQAGGP